MNIVYLAQGPVPSTAANSVHVMRMCQALALLGHKVTLIAPLPPEPVDDPFAFYGVRPLFQLLSFKRREVKGSRLRHLVSTLADHCTLKSMLPALSPDLVYSRYLTGAHTAVSMGLPTILEAHQTLWDSLLGRLLLHRIQEHPKLLQVVVITNALRRLFLQHTRVPEGIISVHHDGADIPEAQPAPVNWPGRPQVLRAGYCGSFHAGRGLPLILELARRIPDWDFHLAGGQPEQFPSLGVAPPPPNVYCHGHLPPSAVPVFLSTCHVLLAPYEHRIAVAGGQGNTADYCSPLKLFEYMASRRPMIVSDLAVFREVLDPSLALLTPPESLNQWEQALRALENPELRKNLADKAFLRFSSSHTWQARAQAILATITTVAE